MIKRSANKQGVVTFNIHFQHLQHPNKCSPNIDTTNTPLYPTDQSHASLLSYRSNPLTPLDYDDQHKALRHESRSISSDVDSSNMEDAQNSENASTRAFQHSHTNDENMSKAVTEDFLTYEPIDFDDLQRVTGNERDDEDKSSAASTLSKSSKKITKAKAGHVYKESRFKEEARNKTKRQAWQPHEDEQVLELVSKHGQSWALIASMMEGRTGKQIRDRYLNKLRPDIKNEEWTREEDKLLITLFKTIGRKWSKIATHLPGRTEGQVKNRFYSHLQKRVLPTDQIGYASASPEGEMSPASKVNEIVSRKAVPSERKFFKEVFHHNAGYKLDKNSLRQQMSNLEGNFDFQEHENLFEGGFQYPEVHQEMGEGRGQLRMAIDPTDVISYNDTSNSDRKSLSPEKYPGKNNFVNKNYRMLPNNSQLNNPDFFLGAYQDNAGFTDLAHEFKARCNTENLTKRGFGGETNFQDRSPLQGVDQFINKDVYNDNKVSYNYKPITGGYGLLKERPSGEMYSRENMSNFASTTTQNPSNSYQYQRENANLF